MKKHVVLLLAVIFFSGVAGKIFAANPSHAVKLNLSGLKKIAEVDVRYQSVNVEMCEVVGGDFWIPYELLDPEKVKTKGFEALKRTIRPVNLYDKKLRTLASALGPMYVRVSGTWANTTYFQDDDNPKLSKAPDGYKNVLTRAEWKGVIDFLKATNAELVTSFAVSNGMRDKDGNWTNAQIEPLVNYTKSIGGKIAAAEMFNEPTFAALGGGPARYDVAWFNRDFSSFKQYVTSALPEMKILGPGSVGEGSLLVDPANRVVAAGEIGGKITTEGIYTTDPKPKFDIFSYHFYGGVSKRCGGKLTPEIELTNEWLGKTEHEFDFYSAFRDKYNPGAPIWLTETAEAACGGNPWASTFNDSFRYLEQLGRLAKKGVQVVMHNTLCASEYALLEQDTYEPRPNYWAALLWNKLMGTKVYDAGMASEGLDVFVHNLKGSANGYAVLVINTKDAESNIEIPAKAGEYVLTADKLSSKTAQLNGAELKLKSNSVLPDIEAKKLKAGMVQIPAKSIVFLTFK